MCCCPRLLRIAKLLLFSVLVPETVPALPEQASYMRRLWRSPATGGPLEVQLIMGKTLERSLGRWVLAMGMWHLYLMGGQMLRLLVPARC